MVVKVRVVGNTTAGMAVRFGRILGGLVEKLGHVMSGQDEASQIVRLV